ncbi:MAG: hypothetical protein AAB503_02320 [Patescibacteria group bacterium]
MNSPTVNKIAQKSGWLLLTCVEIKSAYWEVMKTEIHKAVVKTVKKIKILLDIIIPTSLFTFLFLKGYCAQGRI